MTTFNNVLIRSRLLCAVAGSALGWFSSAAGAQTVSQSPGTADQTTPPSTGHTAANTAGGVSDIIVTAQRRSQNLQSAPVAVTALTPEVLSERNVVTTTDLMQVTPGLQVSTQSAGNGSGSATFFLRGLGQQRAGNGSEPAVGIYIDDIYYPALQGTVFDIVDLQQVEVLRGPQGTLFGRNTIGGAIRYTTRAPTDHFEASLTGTYGSYDRTDVQGTLNVPLGTGAALRITAGHLHRDGFVKRADGTPDAGATTTDLVRGQLRAAPAANVTLDVSGQWSLDKLEGFAYNLPGPIVPLPGTFPFTYNHTPAGIAAPYDNRFQSQCAFCQPGPGSREYNRNNVVTASGTIGWDVSDKVTIKSLSGYTRVRSRGGLDYDGSVRDIFSANQGEFYRAFSEEFQLSGRFLRDRVNLVTGLFYYNERSNLSDGLVYEQVVFGNPIPAQPVTRDTKSYAAFADATVDITTGLSLILGIRQSRDDKTATARTNVGAVIDTQSKNFDSTTYRAGLKYQWTDRIMTYATFSEGFRAGGFNYVPAALTTPGRLFSFDPETLKSFEAGARLELFNRHLRFNPTAFYTIYNHIQLQSVQITPTGNVVRLDNAGRAHTYGVELEAELALSDHLDLFGNLATLHAQYDDIGRATGITLNSKFERAPALTYSVGATYRHDILNGFKAKGTVNFSWQDTQTSTPTNTDLIVLPSYGVLGARIDLTDPSGNYSLSLLGTNLTNQVYYIGGVSYNKNVGAARQDLGRPREFGISLRARFR